MKSDAQKTPASQGQNGLEIEGHSIDFIPDHERTDKLSTQGPFWFVGNFTFFTMTIGFVGPSVGLSSLWTTIAGTLGIMFGTLFMAFHGSQGPHLGLPQMIQSRAQFGYRGVVLVLLATLFVFAGFNIVNLVLMMQGLKTLFAWGPMQVALAVTVPATILAILGHDWMHKTFKWSLFLSLPLYGIVTLAVLMGWIHDAPPVANAPAAAPLGFTWIGFIAQFAAGASYNIAYAPYVSDYSRYLPKNTPSGKLIAAVFLGASLSGAWMIAVGGWLGEHLHATDILVALNSVGASVAPQLGTVVVAITILAFLPVIAMNIYSAKLTAITGVDSFKKVNPTPTVRIWAILGVVFLQVGVALGIYTSGSGLSVLNIYLVVMLYFLVPWTAVNLTDYFFVRKGRYAIPHFFLPHDNIYGHWGSRGLIAYLIGFVAMVPFFTIFNGTEEVYVGPLAKMIGSVDMAWLVGLIVSGVAYYLLCLTLDLEKEEKVIRHIEKTSPHFTAGKGW
ncbi:permease for cytosine/purines uracil thiamine allantoin [Pseudogulbenkiania sp. NH8B]|uniref:purine-cytosine permease family protein n=1 Tax=Pseudogulbenkiania sp. (strain NH8B) TaxID=748280 RepID=UPI0002279C9C|nr:cytosine permease [Pseudogulbenkiania sp. NH8B]BAK77018.1 permease for cytosine/purines uracil thiamine allantoin [Pseudogulbenkiania sp. NH8B]